MKMTSAALTLACAALLGGCAEATAPSGAGDAPVRVAVQGDDAAGSSSAAREGNAAYLASGSAEGQVEVRARVLVQTSTGAWVDLTRGMAEQTVDASGRAGAKLLATTQVSAGGYNRVRVEFERVRANVLAGVQIGAGPLQGMVTVELGSDGKVVVEREVAFQARGEASTEVLVNLNADQWLGRADATTRTTSEAAFQSAVTITAR